MIFFIFIFVLIIGFSVFMSKFNTPYKLTMILGRKGSGKSSLMVCKMLYYYRRGWTIYTDLIGIKLPGIRIFDIKQLISGTPPPKSAVFLDEVGLTMDNRSYKTFQDGLRDWYALQRHYKCVVFINSQAFDVDKKVRDRTDEFLFCQKYGPFSLVRPIVQVVKPNDMTTADCDNPVSQRYRWGSIFEWRFVYLPRYAKLFDSFIVPARPEVQYHEVEMDYALPKRDRQRILRALNKRK